MLDGSTDLLLNRGITLAALGGAYLFLLGSFIAGAACYAASRAWLVISPNRAAQHYGLYVVVVLASLCIATVLENELVPRTQALPYVALPHILAVALLHWRIYCVQEPWLVAAGTAAVAGAGVAAGAVAAGGAEIQAAQWVTLAVLTALLAYLAHQSISTKRGFVTAKSIYASSKEGGAARAAPQRPWLGLAQWAALLIASVILATVNSLLRGNGIDAIPAVAVAGESMLLLAVTAAVCAIPAMIYWLAHKHWMPELTRFAWLAWLVVGFAFTYGNYLTTIGHA